MTGTTMAIDAVLTMEGDSVESCGKPASTRKNWASKAWATVGDIANSAGRSRRQLPSWIAHTTRFTAQVSAIVHPANSLQLTEDLSVSDRSGVQQVRGPFGDLCAN